MKNCLIIGASSGIGLAISKYWIQKGYNVVGTCRASSKQILKKDYNFNKVFLCDLNDNNSLNQLADTLTKQQFRWDVLVVCSGTMEPLGRFNECDFERWTEGLNVNLLGPLSLIHKLIDLSNGTSESPASVIVFAGGGTNSAPIGVSSYTVSKIALTKAVELLDAEFQAISFTIIGPGWVNTKIHHQTISAQYATDASKAETLRRLQCNDFHPMEEVVKCCEWVVNSTKQVVGGRNFSVVHDAWATDTLCQMLEADNDMYKLRRFRNGELKSEK